MSIILYYETGFLFDLLEQAFVVLHIYTENIKIEMGVCVCVSVHCVSAVLHSFECVIRKLGRHIKTVVVMVVFGVAPAVVTRDDNVFEIMKRLEWESIYLLYA